MDVVFVGEAGEVGPGVLGRGRVGGGAGFAVAEEGGDDDEVF